MSPRNDAFVEAIRKELCRGLYQMDGDRGLPYAGPAGRIADALQSQGYGNLPETQTRVESMRVALNELNMAWIAALGLLNELQESHDRAKDAMKRTDEYQSGYLHGLDVAILTAKSKIERIEKDIEYFTTAIGKEQGTNE